jgi:hypothetical protein
VLRQVFPTTSLVARSRRQALRSKLAQLGATPVPASMTAADLAKLVRKLARG